MVQNSVSAFNSSFVGSSAGNAFQWQGGRTALTISAQAYGGGVFLNILGPDDLTWLNVNSTTFSVNQVTAFDLPKGNYQLVSNQSSSIGVYAVLATVPY